MRLKYKTRFKFTRHHGLGLHMATQMLGGGLRRSIAVGNDLRDYSLVRSRTP